MKILKLHVKNFKRDSEITIVPTEHIVSVGGKNRAGKSSALDAIIAAIMGKKAVPGVPLKRGETEGFVRLELDGDSDLFQKKLIVERSFTSDGKQKLRLMGEDGFEAPEPQTLLNGLYGAIGFDPLAFTRMSPKDQADTLKSVVGIDFSELDAERKRVYDDRQQSGRVGKTQSAKVDGMPEFLDAPESEVSVAELVKRQTEMEAKAHANEELGKNLSRAEANLAGLRDSAEEIDRKIADLMQQRETIVGRITSAEQSCEELKARCLAREPVDLSEIKAQIVAADEMNRKVQANARRKVEKAELDRMREEYKSMTERIDAIDAEKQAILSAAKWPVQGLGFDAEGVTLNGLPFNQASSAESLEVSVAMGMAANPKLRVLIIRDGSLLDDDALATVARLAEEHGYQVWIEIVTRNAEDEKRCSVVIEDGLVKKRQLETADVA